LDSWDKEHGKGGIKALLCRVNLDFVVINPAGTDLKKGVPAGQWDVI
jgi:hypothetical protein